MLWDHDRQGLFSKQVMQWRAAVYNVRRLLVHSMTGVASTVLEPSWKSTACRAYCGQLTLTTSNHGGQLLTCMMTQLYSTVLTHTWQCRLKLRPAGTRSSLWQSMTETLNPNP